MQNHNNYPELNDQQQKVVLLLAYYGSAFSGSQKQPRALSVQEVLGKALHQLNIPYHRMRFAGRTDAGVHAKGQVVDFDVASDALIHVPHLQHALNAVLPSTISVEDIVIDADPAFHPLRSARWRWYQYRIHNASYRSVWTPPDAAWIKDRLDVEHMQQAARQFLGEHNFESFKCPRTQVVNNICQVIHSEVTQTENDIFYNVIANRFLYKMVRNMMGLMLEIGQGKAFSSEDIPRILQEQNRQSAGPTAKPQGLSLMAVYYPKPWDFFPNNVYVKSLKQVIQESRYDEKNILRKAS